MVKPIIENDDKIPLELDPLEIYHGIIKAEESKTGEVSILPYDVPREEASKSEKVQEIFTARLEELKTKTETFLEGIENGLDTLPYGIRYVAHLMYQDLRAKFSSESEDHITKVIGNLIYYRYMNPAIVAPEGFDVITSLMSAESRKTLAEISRVLQVITSFSQFKNEYEYLKPLNEWVAQCSNRFKKYLLKCKQPYVYI